MKSTKKYQNPLKPTYKIGKRPMRSCIVQEIINTQQTASSHESLISSLTITDNDIKLIKQIKKKEKEVIEYLKANKSIEGLKVRLV